MTTNNTPANKPKSDDESSLHKLNRELYARDESPTMHERSANLDELGIRRKTILPTDDDTRATTFTSLGKKRATRRRKLWLIGSSAGLLIVLFGASVAGTLWYRQRYNVTSDQIKLAVTAPSDFASGEVIDYSIEYRNDSFVNWQNVELTFETPTGFRFTDSSTAIEHTGKHYLANLGHVPSGRTGQLTVRGQLLGEQNAALVAKAELTVTPENFPSGRFSQASFATTTIRSVPVEVTVDAVNDAENGERVLTTIHVRNSSSRPLANTYLKINPAAGMQLATEDNDFSPGFSLIDARWDVGTIEPLQSVTRQVVVVVDGRPGERRSLDIEVGISENSDTFIQRSLTHVITITASALTIDQQFNGDGGPLVQKPGDVLKGKITYVNVGTTGLKNVVVKVAFEGIGLDPATLKLPTGAYDPATKTITWTAASIPTLATVQPAQTGEIEYEFSLLPATSFPTGGTQTKNHVIIANATIDSPDLITSTGERRNAVADRAVISVATTLALQVDAFYDDGRLGLTSTGPVPPAAGQQTSYTLRLRLGSALNDVGDVRVAAVLPDGVTYTGQHYKTTGEVTYNDRAGELLWNIPQVTALTGRAKPPEELHIQVAITPGEHQVDQTITFLKKLTAEATDLFTEQAVTAEVTNFPDTESAVKEKGRVVR